MLRLNDKDGRAIDLLLDARRSSPANGGGNGDGDGSHSSHTYATSNGDFAQRLARAEQLLEVLSAMPAGEPSSSLVQRTLQVVATRGKAVAPPVHQPAVSTRPHA